MLLTSFTSGPSPAAKISAANDSQLRVLPRTTPSTKYLGLKPSLEVGRTPTLVSWPVEYELPSWARTTQLLSLPSPSFFPSLSDSGVLVKV